MRSLARRLIHRARAWRRDWARRAGRSLEANRRLSPIDGILWNAAFLLFVTIETARFARRGSLTWSGLSSARRMARGRMLLRLAHWADRKIPCRVDAGRTWLDRNRLQEWERASLRARAAEWNDRPFFSVLVAVHEAPPAWIDRAVRSVLDQVYDRWELILVDDGSTSIETRQVIARWEGLDERITSERFHHRQGVSRALDRAAELAHGEWLAFLDHDDELEPDALFEAARHLRNHPRTDVVYTDEAIVAEDGRSWPVFKPGPSPEQFWTCNYACHLLVVRRKCFEEVDGFRAWTDGVQDYDLILRLLARGARFGHVPRVLYRWHQTRTSLSRQVDAKTGLAALRPEIGPLSRRIVEEHFRRIGVAARAEIVGDWVRPVFENRGRGRVSILVCTKDRPWRLWRCIRSIEGRTDYGDYEILIVDNGSRSRWTRWVLGRLADRHRILRIESGPEGFSFAAINNQAARAASGRYLLFLNDDVVVRRREWLTALVGALDAPGVGAAGARLLFPSGRIQHAGIILGAMGWGPWHLWYGARASRPDVRAAAAFVRNCAAVTGACLLTRRSRFEALGGFDERLAVDFNDVDYCLRLAEQGYRTVYVPQATLAHVEKATRRRDLCPREARSLKERHEGQADPYWNPNFARWSYSMEIDGYRRPRGTLGRPARILVVARPAGPLDPWPHAEAIVHALRDRAALDFRELPWEDELAPLLLRDLESDRVDVVLAQGWETASVVREAFARGLPTVWNLPGRLLPASLGREAAARFLSATRAIDAAYQVVFNNVSALRWAAQRFPQDRMTVLDGVLFEPGPRPGARRRPDLRRELGADERTVVFVAFDSPSDRDGAAVPGRAFASLPPALRSRALLVQVRTPGDRGSAMNRDARIRVVESADGGRELLLAADVALVHAVADDRPLAALWALEAGLPILGTRELVQGDLLSPGRTGLEAAAYRPRAWRAAIERFIDDEDLRTRCGSAGSDWLASRAGPEKVLDQWAALLVGAAEFGRGSRRAAGASPRSKLLLAGRSGSA